MFYDGKNFVYEGINRSNKRRHNHRKQNKGRGIMSKKITLICSRSISVVKFRKGLVKELQKNNYEITIIALDNDREKEIREWGVNFYCIPQNNRGTSPLDKVKLFKSYTKILNNIKPDVVFTFQITPNTIGALAAHLCKVKKIFSMVEGVGDVFIYNNFKWKIIRFFSLTLLKISFLNVKKVFFINNDDRDEFVSKGIINKDKTKVLPGIGVDLNYFTFKDIRNTNTFLLAARLMPAKGIIEFCKAARIVKKEYPKTTFNIIGEEFTLKKTDIQEYIDDGSIVYKGFQEDIRPFVEECYMNVLPSYREGFGLVIAEAGAMGRASIASNTQGCKEAIIDNETGLLFKNKDYNELANKMIYAINHIDEITNMSADAYKLCKQKYDQGIVNKEILKIIEE